MATREFDGTDDYIELGGDGTTIGTVPRSIVGLIKPTALATGEFYIGLSRASDDDTIFGMYDGNVSGELTYSSLNGDRDTVTTVTAADWQILGVDKAAGAELPRGHRKVLGSGSWTHTNAASTVADTSAVGVAWDATQVGRYRASEGLYKNMRLAVLAVFDYQLADADYEAIEAAASTQSIYNLGPTALWEFNQASVATAVEDLVGSLDQTAITGTTAVADDPTWTFGLGGTQVAWIRA